jgi:DNA primase
MDIKDIIDAIDIVEYVSQYADLKKQSNGEYISLSPFKEEANPSFTISPHNQLFYDFSTNQGGNIIDFIQKYNKCSLVEAINLAKQYANLTDDYVDNRLNATKVIKKFKNNNQKKEKSEHVILEKNIMSKYENDKEKLKTWLTDGISYDIMEKYQVRYDPFSDRIVFPVKDNNGTIINIKGRTLTPNFEEKNIRKYTYFYKLGQNDFIFGYYEHLNDYIDKKEIILFEGEKSVMICEGWGIKNTGAIMTSHLDESQMKTLIQLGVTVVFALDKNINIKKDDNIKKLKRYVRVEYIEDSESLIGEKDAPVDKGKETWDILYEGRKRLK